MKYREVKNSYTDDDLCGELEDRIEEGSDEYISDLISEIADDNVDTYVNYLLDYVKELYDNGYYKRVNDEFGLSGDLIKDLQSAQYLEKLDILYENLDNVVKNVAYKMFERNDIELNHDLCSEIDHDVEEMDKSEDVAAIKDEINKMIESKKIDLEKNKKEERSI